MAKFSLIPYPGKEFPEIDFTCELNQNAESLYISYKLGGDLSALDFGDGTPKRERKIKLWEKTCFELFLKNSKGEYIEFNLSPEFEWNVFYFEKKGDALKESDRFSSPKFDILLSLPSFHLIAEIKKSEFPESFFTGSESLGLSAGITSVIKEKSGRLSYWALSHEDQRPNFHHPDSFRYKF
jgi:hypothetical protein